MGWTILNLIGFAIGCKTSKVIWKDRLNGKGLVIGNILVTLVLGLVTGFHFGIVFLITSQISAFIGAIFMEPSDPNGYRFGDEQKAWNAQQAAKARANPTLPCWIASI